MKRWLLLISLSATLAAHAAEEAAKPLVLPPGFAKSDFDLAPLPKAATETKTFALHWIKPDLMAHWLDPEKYAAPVGMDLPLPVRSSPSSSGWDYATRGPAFEMPAGLESWKPLPEKNAIEARGTMAALEEFEQMLGVRDQPLKEIDLSVTFYKIERRAFETMSAPFGTSTVFLAPSSSDKMKTGPVMIFATRDLFERLALLVQEGHAEKSDLSRRVVNNMTGAFDWSENRSIDLKTPDSPQTGSTSEPSAHFEAKTRSQITIVPTINGDGTITVLLTPNFQASSRSSAQQPNVPVVTSQLVDSVAIVRDGDSILVEAGVAPKTDAYRYFWLVTPRVRH